MTGTEAPPITPDGARERLGALAVFGAGVSILRGPTVTSSRVSITAGTHGELRT
jgi:hypothetical protein